MVSVSPRWWQPVGGPRDRIWDLVALVWPIWSRVITTSSALVRCWNFFGGPSVGFTSVGFERAAAFQFRHEHETTGLRTNLHLFVNVDVYHDLDHLNDLVAGEDGWSHSSCLVFDDNDDVYLDLSKSDMEILDVSTSFTLLGNSVHLTSLAFFIIVMIYLSPSVWFPIKGIDS